MSQWVCRKCQCEQFVKVETLFSADDESWFTKKKGQDNNVLQKYTIDDRSIVSRQHLACRKCGLEAKMAVER